MTLFHIISREALTHARETGQLIADSLATQGFVHGCYRSQLVTVADLVFPDAESLLVVELDRRTVGSPVVDEAADPTIEGSPAELFPHIYGPISIAAVIAEHELRRGAGGFELAPTLQGDRNAARLTHLVERFDWYHHPEGMLFFETDRSEQRTCGHWLFQRGAVSKFHRVKDSDEIWVVQEGRLLVHVLNPSGGLDHYTLGFGPGEHATLTVPAGYWQAAELAPGESYAFGTNVCAPPFTFEGSLELADSTLAERFPDHSALIERLV